MHDKGCDVEDPDGKSGDDGRTPFGRELTSFLDEVPEGRRGSFEGTIIFELHNTDV